MRLIDLDQQIIVPICDETKGMTYETSMTIAEFFERFLDGFCPEIVDAVPVEWLRKIRKGDNLTLEDVETIDWLLAWWKKEQEGR